MKTAAFLLVILLWPTVSLLQSCCDEPPDCIYIPAIKAFGFDNSGREPVSATAKAIRSQAFMLRMETMDSLAYGGCAFQFSDVAPSVKAFKCDGGTVEVDKVLWVRISSDARFDVMHPAGADLTSQFFIEAQDEKTLSNTNTYYLRHPVADSGIHRFTIAALMESGDTLRAQTDPISLIP